MFSIFFSRRSTNTLNLQDEMQTRSLKLCIVNLSPPATGSHPAHGGGLVGTPLCRWEAGRGKGPHVQMQWIHDNGLEATLDSRRKGAEERGTRDDALNLKEASIRLFSGLDRKQLSVSRLDKHPYHLN